jgi:biotin transport system substrate-specific component
MFVGSAVIYVFGLSWLYTVLAVIRGAAGWDIARVLNAGMVPFLAGDLVKLLLAAALLPMAWKIARRIRG